MIRLFIPEPFAEGAVLPVSDAQAHYLRHVMRLSLGSTVRVFNGADGEWEATLCSAGKRDMAAQLICQRVAFRATPDIALAFAMIKQKSERVVEQATELGVSRIDAVLTQRAVVKEIRLPKLIAHAVEAAEQCERHDVPRLCAHASLADFLEAHSPERALFYGDERGGGVPLGSLPLTLPLTVLIGPEGGFSDAEHHMLQRMSYAQGFGMGPRILRADTAAIAALACFFARVGDWQTLPRFEQGV